MPSQRCGGWLLALLVLTPLPPALAEPGMDVGRKTPPAVRAEEESAIPVTHLDEDDDGWSVAESANFRLCHQHSSELAAEVLRTAERTRVAQQRKWFGAAGADWSPRCRLILYPSARAYSQATGAPLSPGGGHTDVSQEEGRVLDRCVHLHGNRRLLLNGLVPHEVTHAVLAGRFGGERVPRWADEGMAVLAETRPHIDLHLRQLAHWRDDDLLLAMRDLIRLRDYPAPRAVGAFYAQSVSLVDFLTRQKGARCFATFVRDGERDGYTASLRRHYGWTFAELDRRWQRHAFGERAVEATSGGGG